MKQKIAVIIGITLITGAIAVIKIRTSNSSSNIASINQENNQKQAKDIRFSGKISDIDLSCHWDGICQIKVGDYWIITEQGGDPRPENSNEKQEKGKIFDPKGLPLSQIDESSVGKQVEVYAQVLDNSSLSLYGNNAYYVKFN